MKIEIKKPNDKELEELGVKNWPIWEKEVSKFDWSYSDREQCYLLEGKVKVTAGTETAEFGKGDFVTFPQGLSCVWEVLEPVKKHYKFG